MQRNDSSESNDKIYRLNTDEINSLTRKLALCFNDLPIDTLDTFLPVVHQESRRKFYICQMSRDSFGNHSGTHMPYLWETIRNFIAEKNDRHCILLMPIMLCRNFALLPSFFPKIIQREHAVLLEVDFVRQQIHFHDSQGFLQWLAYPDKVKETVSEMNKILKTNFTYDAKDNYHHYGNQVTSYDCGYFVYQYIRHFLRFGSAVGLENIQFSISNHHKNKHEFLNAKLADHSPLELARSNVSVNSDVNDDFDMNNGRQP